MSKPIGVYDSGIGGYTVLNVLKKRFPQENWLYLQDAQHRPYGSRSQQELVHLGRRCIDTLQAAGVKACVVACHTSSALALRQLESYYDIPLLGMLKPSVRAICEQPEQPLLWLATRASVLSNQLIKTARKSGFTAEVCPVICDGWVEKIEQEYEGEGVQAMIEHTLAPHRKWIARYNPRVFYGCTHYPWLDNSLKQVLGEDLLYADPAHWVVEDLHSVLEQHSNNAESATTGKVIKLSSARCIQAVG